MLELSFSEPSFATFSLSLRGKAKEPKAARWIFLAFRERGLITKRVAAAVRLSLSIRARSAKSFRSLLIFPYKDRDLRVSAEDNAGRRSTTQMCTGLSSNDRRNALNKTRPRETRWRDERNDRFSWKTTPKYGHCDLWCFYCCSNRMGHCDMKETQKWKLARITRQVLFQV